MIVHHLIPIVEKIIVLADGINDRTGAAEKKISINFS